jgi:GTP-binding protein Era
MSVSLNSHAGFVAIFGASNVGKSTLLNRFVGAKVSIVSPKVQTTRSRVLGICIQDNTQIIFIDTPGIFKPKRRLDRAMVSAAWGGVREADKILLIIDASRGYDGDSRGIIKRLTEKNQKAMLAINKIDLVAKPKLLKLTNELNSSAVFTDIFMISAELGDGVDDLMAHLIKDIPAGPWLFPEDQISDMPGRLTASEITREKLYLQLYQELPYAASVETEGWKEQKDDSIRIEQVIYVERASQKAIILGKGGSRIKALGKASREELEEIFEKRVHLFLFVKVREKWGDDPERYRDLGLDFDA